MKAKQEEKIRKTILAIKRELAAEKKKFGGYHDGRGFRYALPELYLKLHDYKGALRYFKWFDKTFEDDGGYGAFFFEWAITLFKVNQAEAAKKKILQTLISNGYLIDVFLDNLILATEKYEGSDWELQSSDIGYSKDQPELIEFAQWLLNFTQSERYISVANELLEIKKMLLGEPVGDARTKLVNRLFKLREHF
jgi:hypothetical protein